MSKKTPQKPKIGNLVTSYKMSAKNGKNLQIKRKKYTQTKPNSKNKLSFNLALLMNTKKVVLVSINFQLLLFAL